MPDLPEKPQPNRGDLAQPQAGEGRLVRAVSGGWGAVVSTVLAVGVWDQGLSALWRIASESAPLVAAYWWLGLLIVLGGSMVLNITRPTPPERKQRFVRRWTSAMLILAGVGAFADAEPVDEAADTQDPGRLTVEIVQAYGPGTFTPPGATQPSALNLITYVVTIANAGGAPTRAQEVSAFVPASRDGQEYRCAPQRVRAGLTLSDGDSLSVAFGEGWILQNGWEGEDLQPRYERDAIILCVIDDTAERAAYTAATAAHRVVVVDSDGEATAGSAAWSDIRISTLSGSRFESLADRVER